MLFLPQHPYLTLGDLRCQLVYPYLERDVSDAELLELLRRVNLPTLAQRVGGLHVPLDWPKVLSVGEQQRLAWARVLLSRPRYVMLDEATSALDPANEESVYRQLVESHHAGEREPPRLAASIPPPHARAVRRGPLVAASGRGLPLRVSPRLVPLLPLDDQPSEATQG